MQRQHSSKELKKKLLLGSPHNICAEGATSIFLAYSGGLDSRVLLQLLVEARCENPKLKLTAIHINHGLSANAKKWESHCKVTCKKLKVKCLIKKVNAKKKINDHSPEEIARKLRYEALAKILPPDGCLLTAHQADDQAETLLLQLFRGAGPKGLASMPAKIKYARGWLVRPLLQFTRSELLKYARSLKLEWIEDESNLSLKYDRNFIRRKILPLIGKRWPAITASLNRVAAHSAEASELLFELAQVDYEKVVGSVKNTLAVDKLLLLSTSRQRNVIRYWLHRLNLALPSEVKLNEVLRTVINARSDAQPLVTWHGVEVRRYQQNLYAQKPLLHHDNTKVIRWNLLRPLKLPGDLGVLRADSKFKKLDPKKITVRFRQGGEVCKIKGRRGTHELKKLFQEWQIPPWMRDRIPLVYYGDKLIALRLFSDNPSLIYFSEKIVHASSGYQISFQLQ